MAGCGSSGHCSLPARLAYPYLARRDVSAPSGASYLLDHETGWRSTLAASFRLAVSSQSRLRLAWPHAAASGPEPEPRDVARNWLNRSQNMQASTSAARQGRVTSWKNRWSNGRVVFKNPRLLTEHAGMSDCEKGTVPPCILRIYVQWTDLIRWLRRIYVEPKFCL